MKIFIYFILFISYFTQSNSLFANINEDTYTNSSIKIQESEGWSFNDCKNVWDYDIIRTALYSNDLINLHYEYINFVCKIPFKILDRKAAIEY